MLHACTLALLSPGLEPLALSNLRHLVLRVDPESCHSASAACFEYSIHEVVNLGSLKSLYIGLSGKLQGSQKQTTSLNLSSLQDLKSLHIDSFWPDRAELPPGCDVHASLRMESGQETPGVWAGSIPDVLKLRLPLTSAHFVQTNASPPGRTAALLWPLRVRRGLDTVRVSAQFLCLSEELGGDTVVDAYPGLMEARSVVIAASDCCLIIRGSSGLEEF